MQTSKDKIINAAITEFALYGFDGARVDHIAKKAKINKAMIYYHFKNKEKLYASILQNLAHTIYTLIQNNFQKAMEESNPLIIIEAYAHHISKLDSRYFMIIMRELSSGGRFIKSIIVPTIIEPVATLIGNVYINALQNGVVKELHPQHTMISVAGAVIFYNLVRQILQGTHIHEKFFNNPDAYIDNLIHIFAHGMLNKEDI